jgi:hypothetical protein
MTPLWLWRGLRGEALGHLLAGTEQPRGESRLAYAQGTGCFAVGQAKNVHRHKRQAEVVFQSGVSTSSSAATVSGRREAVRRPVRNVLRSTRIR